MVKIEGGEEVIIKNILQKVQQMHCFEIILPKFCKKSILLSLEKGETKGKQIAKLEHISTFFEKVLNITTKTLNIFLGKI